MSARSPRRWSWLLAASLVLLTAAASAQPPSGAGGDREEGDRGAADREPADRDARVPETGDREAGDREDTQLRVAPPPEPAGGEPHADPPRAPADPGPSVEPPPGPEGRGPHVDPPPDPEDREPELLVDVHLGGLIPLEAADICPGDSLCVLGAGGLFGVEIERRWPMGLGVSVAYDAWFVDSGGVFELGVVQIVRAAIKYVFGYDWLIHPAVHIGGGALVFGDSFLVSTLGGAAEAGVSAELELTGSVSLTGALNVWLFTTSPFTTGRDRTRRSEGVGLNVALQLHVGLVILAASGGP